jgi:arabinofuranosyltransferase
LRGSGGLLKPLDALSRISWIRTAFLVLIGVLILRTAWIADDAYITFRTIDNWSLGYGPVWNISERVQAYTHPLWMLVLALLHSVTGELYYTCLVLSLVVSLAAAGRLLWKVEGERLVLIGLLMCCCKAYIDYSTSGLEDPLSHLLIVAAGLSLLTPNAEIVHLRRSTLLVALAGTTRLDLLILLGPALLFQWQSLRGSTGRWQAVLVGLLPLLLWESFATLYYGHPLPNSALAKLGARPWTELAPKGVLYLWNSLRWDPILLMTLTLGFVPALGSLRSDWRPSGGLALGGILSLFYVVSVGGDFMSGRFLTGPFVLALVLLAHSRDLPDLPLRLLGAVALCQGILHPLSPWRSGTEFTHYDWDDAAIADERGYYYADTGLLKLWADGRDPIQPGRRTPPEDRRVVVMETVGVDGYTAGPEVHIIDQMALGDPLLSRMACTDDHARIGHYKRLAPEGYIQSLQQGQNLIVDPQTKALFSRVQTLTRGDILDGERLGLVLRMLGPE